MRLRLLPRLAQQAQDVQCPSYGVLLSSIVAWRRCSNLLGSDCGAVELFPILLDITRGPGVIGVVPMGMAHIDLRAGTYGGLNYSEFVLLALG